MALSRCEYCKATFEPVRSDQKYCSRAHRQADYEKRQRAEEAKPPSNVVALWEPQAQTFAEGNRAAVTHGFRSKEMVAKRTEAVRAEYLDRFPWLSDRDEIKLDTFFSDLARYRMLDDWILGVCSGEIETSAKKGRPTVGIEAVPAYIWDQASKLSNSLGKHANELGLDPSGFAKIAKDASFTEALRGEKVKGLSAVGIEMARARNVNV